MKAPLSWLKEYVDIEMDNKAFADAMTLSGSKVEGVENPYGEISKVVVGKIVSLTKHPDADKLRVSQVDIGSEMIQIVTGAPNVKEGDVIPVALVGATLPGGKSIGKGKLRGVDSLGMMCSMQELNLSKENFPEAPEDGVFILPNDTELGRDVKEVLGLFETIVEFEITPNRPDCLNMIGLAREASATFRKPFRKPLIAKTGLGKKASEFASVEILDSELCKRYIGRVVENLKIGPSPKWLRDRLTLAGVRPINNIVDITNYVLLEYGQPMHAFDLDKIEGHKIIVRKAHPGERIVTLDEQERVLDAQTLVIADASKPVAVAGVMGGLHSRVTEETKTILLESANFEGAAIRIASKKLGLRSESSARFEKGLDPENALPAIDRACELIEMLGIGEVRSGAMDVGHKSSAPTKIPFRPDKINAFLGTQISEQDMVETFKWLSFEMDWEARAVIIPSFRNDVKLEADLSEEVARFFDYNHIEATLLSGKTGTQGRKTLKQKAEDKIKQILLAQGLYETCTYSFESPKVYDQLRLPKGDDKRVAVTISNPLGEDYSVMRTSTIPSMLKVLAINYNRRVDSAGLFEISNEYHPDVNAKDGLPEEKTVVTIGMYGSCDFYDMKGLAEEVMGQLGIQSYEMVPESGNPTFHPGRTGKILIDHRVVGVLGQIHPEVAEAFECAKETFVCVLELRSLVENATMLKKVKPLPKYPAMQRDMALVVREEILVKQIEDIIRNLSGKILEEVNLFDIYRGKQVQEGMKSVAYSVTFRDPERTLTDDEVNKVMEDIIQRMQESLGAQLRIFHG